MLYAESSRLAGISFCPCRFRAAGEYRRRRQALKHHDDVVQQLVFGLVDELATGLADAYHGFTLSLSALQFFDAPALAVPTYMTGNLSRWESF